MFTLRLRTLASLAAFTALVSVGAPSAVQAGLLDRGSASGGTTSGARSGFGGGRTSSSCDSGLPSITSGYGANGPYGVEHLQVKQRDYNEPVHVFFPKGLSGKLPVVFYVHGYGPNVWSANEALSNHIVSRGVIYVFVPYPMAASNMDGRYEKVWNGIAAATEHFSDRMDLSRVGFVGHSFGGGANPAIAFHGIVGNGWGKNGAFMMELAPWYSYQISNEQLQQFPSHVLHVGQIYDNDTINDPRMAIDIHASMRTSVNLLQKVRSQTVNGCKLEAGHGVPGPGSPMPVKQYALFRTLDALSDQAFNGNRGALASLAQPANDSGYNPIEFISNPTPDQPESFYTFKWNGEKNPRAKGGNSNLPSDATDGSAGGADTGRSKHPILDRLRARRQGQ